MSSLKKKAYCCILKTAYLALVLGLVALPYFQYADGHIHVIAGEVIIHWHYVPDSNKHGADPKNHGHRHSAAELTIISSLNGLHAYIADLTMHLVPQVYSIDYVDLEKSQIQSVYQDNTSARAPPAVS